MRDAAAAGAGGDFGTFVWADATDADFTSTGTNQFLIRAGGGVGIGTNDPSTALDVVGTVTANAFSSASPLLLQTAGTTRVYVDNATGRVGIGTNAPGSVITNSKLDVVGGHVAVANNFGFFCFNSTNDGIGSGIDSRNDDALDVWAGGGIRMYLTAAGNVGIGRTPTAFRLEVEGEVSKSVAGSWLANSDRRIKTNIETVTHALDTLDRVRLVNFEYTDDYRKAHAGVGTRRYLNVIAQEFAEVFPEHVKGGGEYLPDGSEILQVDAYPLTIYAAAAIQELHAKSREKDAQVVSLRGENEELRKKSAELEERLARIEAMLSVQSSQVKGDAR